MATDKARQGASLSRVLGHFVMQLRFGMLSMPGAEMFSAIELTNLVPTRDKVSYVQLIHLLNALISLRV